MTLIESGSDRALSSLSTADLRARLAEAIQITAERLAQMAAIWAELERRGEDLSDLRRGIGHYLPLVAAGHLAAEAVVAFAGSKTLLKALATLPLAEQRRLAAGGLVPLAVQTADGVEIRNVPPVQIPARMVPSIIAQGHVRSGDEQTALLGLAPSKAARRKSGPAAVRLSPDRQSIMIGRKKAPIADVLAALTDAAGSPAELTEDDETRAFPVTLSSGEHRALKIAAARSGRTMNSLIRMALAVAGLIGEDER